MGGKPIQNFDKLYCAIAMVVAVIFLLLEALAVAGIFLLLDTFSLVSIFGVLAIFGTVCGVLGIVLFLIQSKKFW